MGLWVNSRHVWFKLGDCQSENVWMCDSVRSFTFGVVLVSVLYSLVSLSSGSHFLRVLGKKAVF